MSRTYFDHVGAPKGSRRRSSEHPREKRSMVELTQIAREHFGLREHVTLSTDERGQHVIETTFEPIGDLP